jgi:hypothetical protein
VFYRALALLLFSKELLPEAIVTFVATTLFVPFSDAALSLPSLPFCPFHHLCFFPFLSPTFCGIVLTWH